MELPISLTPILSFMNIEKNTKPDSRFSVSSFLAQLIFLLWWEVS